MNYFLEGLYTFIESALVTIFISLYFDLKLKISKPADIGLSFLIILGFDSFATVFDWPWTTVLILFVSTVMIVLEIFFKGSLLEHLLIAIIAVSLLALTDVCVITLLSKLFDVEYKKLVRQSDVLRFFAVMVIKIMYLLIVSIIISIKRKYTILFHKIEYLLISSTLIISGIMISLVRNIIYTSRQNYVTFLIILLCAVLINIIQYCTIIYISNKNISEKNMTMMRKQLEMQNESIKILEKKYDENSKIRHDMKNFISCALNLAENGESEELINYLRELSQSKIGNMKDYVLIERKTIGAVINSKMGIAEQDGIDVKCIILDEMNNVSDIDAGILLANLLDNALEACAKNLGHSEIILKIWSKAGYYCIEISNTVETDVLKYNPNLFTSKKDKSIHGIGLKSVRDIVEKYNGMINFSQSDNKFRVCVSLSKEVICLSVDK